MVVIVDVLVGDLSSRHCYSVIMQRSYWCCKVLSQLNSFDKRVATGVIGVLRRTISGSLVVDALNRHSTYEIDTYVTDSSPNRRNLISSVAIECWSVVHAPLALCTRQRYIELVFYVRNWYVCSRFLSELPELSRGGAFMVTMAMSNEHAHDCPK